MKRIDDRTKEIERKRRICHFAKKDGNIILPKICEGMEKEEILNIFKENIKVNTFLYIILPFIFFGLLFVLITIFLFIYFNRIDIRLSVFFIFLDILFLIFSLIKLIMYIRKMKCYLSRNNRRTFYNMISKNEYLNIINYLEGKEI